MHAVAADGVWKYFGDYPALRGASLEVAKGACVALIGRNGAGKTTLLRILAGLSKPSKGEVSHRLRPHRLSRPRHRRLRRSLRDRKSHAVRPVGRAARIPNDAANAALERVGLTRVKDGLAREFSRGMRQRLAIARAFLHNPELLLLDEPFTSLDDRAIAVLQKLLSDARARGSTIIMSTHQIREAMELASDVALLERGTHRSSPVRASNEMLLDPGWLYRTYGEHAET